MLSLFQRKPVLAAVGAAILIAGAVVGAWRYAVERDDMLADLMIEARRCAVAFEPAELRSLAGTKADVGTPVYAAVKARLMRLREVEDAVHYVYLFRYLPAEKKVVYLGDSAPPGDKDESLPGDD